ncbi:hypothetical protein CIL05_16485 [Virgibacillus profundi]|uniref:DUF2508 domain-containing protein n=1 Tax=Virgibacillus profundi TaxID=2024555 RepID=A0A2A2I950_9BACI|nr:YaaL family protein [Virgibacillus profundi]PAV28531.1 hypothetical protein CIL05_16485 [Virgibacillus profundi]PXY52704.1 DUF2508 domain-containing protein [Virgibacillus profundi]
MGKKRIKRVVDEELLDAIFELEREWKQIESLMEKSMEPTFAGSNSEALAKAKYLFLLREARQRKLSAIRRI